MRDEGLGLGGWAELAACDEGWIGKGVSRFPVSGESREDEVEERAY